VLSARRKLEAVNQSGSERALEAGPVARELAGVQEALEQAAQGRAANIFGSKQASSSAPPPPAQAQPPGATSQGATPPPPGPPPGINKSNPPTSAKQPQR
ncbi:MAG TPA: hypothetical protein VM691_04740, partial [Myxococcales bacterium]|nr:hypothetical protein [Myxococcales bacterium]